MPEQRAGAEICKKCGVNKVGTDAWNRTYCFACGWSPTTRTEGPNLGSSEAVVGSGDESEDLVSS